MSQDIRSFLELIASSNNIAIISHQAPDVDAFSSSMALRELIRKFHSKSPEGKNLRKRIHIFLDYEELPQSLNIFLQKPDEELPYLNPKKHLKSYDLVIALDSASLERLGKYQDVFNNGKATINVDHHATNTKFAQHNIVLKTSSTCEALYYLMVARQKKEVTKYIFSLLYAGILTDTNNLKNNADSTLTEKAVSNIKQNLGTNLAKRVKANFFENNSPAKDELYAFAYSKKHRNYFADGKLCIINLNNKVFSATDASMEDAEGIVDEALYRKGVLVSAILLEKEKGKIYVKLRARNGIDVSILAKQFNGGGHTQQAAFQYEGKSAVLLQELSKKAQSFLQEIEYEPVERCPELFE